MMTVADRPGALPSSQIRSLFERAVHSTPALSRAYPLEVVNLDGAFIHYRNPETQNLWVGFSLGMRCAERMSKVQS